MYTATHPEAVAFIDIEAAGLGSNGYPTELGWAIVVNGSVVSDSCLIRPPTRWTTYANSWSAAAERLTGITRELLDREGLSPVEAMQRFLAAVAGRELFSDEPDFDNYWLGMLAKAALVDPAELTIGDARRLLREEACHEAVSEPQDEAPRHRAGPDALRLALAYARHRTIEGSTPSQL